MDQHFCFLDDGLGVSAEKISLVPKLCLGTHLPHKLRLFAKQSFAHKYIPKEDFGNEITSNIFEFFRQDMLQHNPCFILHYPGKLLGLGFSVEMPVFLLFGRLSLKNSRNRYAEASASTPDFTSIR